MGRGRAKAKQTKVARALKYGGPQTDFDRLQAELGSSGESEHTIEDDFEVVEDDVSEDDDPYAKYYDDEDDSEEESAGASGR
jgi:hypothetical protein